VGAALGFSRCRCTPKEEACGGQFAEHFGYAPKNFSLSDAKVNNVPDVCQLNPPSTPSSQRSALRELRELSHPLHTAEKVRSLNG